MEKNDLLKRPLRRKSRKKKKKRRLIFLFGFSLVSAKVGESGLRKKAEDRGSTKFVFALSCKTQKAKYRVGQKSCCPLVKIIQHIMNGIFDLKKLIWFQVFFANSKLLLFIGLLSPLALHHRHNIVFLVFTKSHNVSMAK